MSRSVYRHQAAANAVRDHCRNTLSAWSTSFDSTMLTTSAGLTHAVFTGSGGPVVVVVPGTNISGVLLERFATVLARAHRVVLLDVPGQPGLSAELPPGGDDRMPVYGGWLAEAMEQVAPEGAVVVGHSLGAAISLACGSPLVQARVLASPAGLAPLRVTPALLAATVRWQVQQGTEPSAALLQRMVAPGTDVHAPLVEWFELLATHCRTSLAPPPLPSEVLAARTGVPRVVATGAHDVFLPARRLRGPAGKHLGVEVQEVSDAGHLLLDEQPARVVALVDLVQKARRLA
ncbi:alpha/beta fold hydrolase [Antribacter gilvus]|uniref:alpha/beta fold hydrolase n=1 Tax=Antribacter gilvus TaxID=2304675 RepID=UPI000F7A3BDE|nr:alpha/beta fold hydrolase [Antribacter gilvus]